MRQLILPMCQGSFLLVGIPSINLGSESAYRGASGVRRNSDETADDIEAASIEDYGRDAERILRSSRVCGRDSRPDAPAQSAEIN